MSAPTHSDRQNESRGGMTILLGAIFRGDMDGMAICAGYLLPCCPRIVGRCKRCNFVRGLGRVQDDA